MRTGLMVQRSLFMICGLLVFGLLGMAQTQPVIGLPPGSSQETRQDAIKLLEQSIDGRDIAGSIVRAETVRGQLLGPFTPAEIAAAQNRENEQLKVAILPIFLEYERKAPGPGKWGRASFLPNLTCLSWLAGQYEKTKSYADESATIGGGLTGVDDKHLVLYWGYHFLGLLASAANDFDSAKSYLIRSGEVAGGPALAITGPNMTLAKVLLERGETNSVLAFMAAWSGRWNQDGGRLALWESVVRGGAVPDFKRSLETRP